MAEGQIDDKPQHPWLVVVVVCLGQLMVVLDATMVQIALPSGGFHNSAVFSPLSSR